METWPYRSENVPSGCILVNIDGEPVWVRESAWSGAGGTLRDDELIMAVIEAAKAYADVRWAEPYKDNADQADRENLSRFALLDAVEALLAAEGE